jgi:hypothetical protein
MPNPGGARRNCLFDQLANLYVYFESKKKAVWVSDKAADLALETGSANEKIGYLLAIIDVYTKIEQWTKALDVASRIGFYGAEVYALSKILMRWNDKQTGTKIFDLLSEFVS